MMIKNSIIIIFLLTLTLNFVSGQVEEIRGITHQSIQIKQNHPNMTSCNITKIEYPNTTTDYTIIPMLTVNSINFYYTLNDTNLNGDYVVTTCGNGNGALTCMDYKLRITPTGDDLQTSQSTIFAGLLLLLILFLIGGLYGLNRAINGAWKIAYICLAYLSLFCIFFTSWLFSTNYLWATPILASIFWILWLTMAYGFFPFILIMGAYIVGKGVKDNLFKQYKAEGFTDEEAKDMAKRKRR